MTDQGLQTETVETGTWLEPIHQQWVATLDAIRDAIFVIDSDNRLIRVNRSFADMAESEISFLLQRRIQAVLPWLMDENGQVSNNQAVSPDGKVYRIRSSANAPCLHGRVHILEDITEHSALQLAEEKYREGTARSLVETIDALSNALEAKDPYTKLHSRNVASLARSIAGRIGLNAIEAQGIFYGAEIHDIGKLSIPSGILSKPGELVQAEINLIQLHCESGYAVVKDLTFPWPVHDIILQHHERLDGSGYPAGLKGDEISPAARIVAVADVVEAMSSHRPYRAALGIDAALSEIKAGRGVLYDADVVDACLGVFNDEGMSAFEAKPVHYP